MVFLVSLFFCCLLSAVRVRILRYQSSLDHNMTPSAITTNVQPDTGSDPKPCLNHQPTHTGKLYSSGGPIDSDSIGQLRPTDSSTPVDEIRRRYAEEGYVWLKGLLPAADVWKARKDYFEFLQPTGLLKKDTDPHDGIYCGGDWRLVSLPTSVTLNIVFTNINMHN